MEFVVLAALRDVESVEFVDLAALRSKRRRVDEIRGPGYSYRRWKFVDLDALGDVESVEFVDLAFVFLFWQTLSRWN